MRAKNGFPLWSSIHVHCLHHRDGRCLACAKRCPVDAITPEDAHDKEKCYQRVADSTRRCARDYGMFIYRCGLCATRVPCEAGIPPAPKKSP